MDDGNGRTGLDRDIIKRVLHEDPGGSDFESIIKPLKCRGGEKRVQRGGDGYNEVKYEAKE